MWTWTRCRHRVNWPLIPARAGGRGKTEMNVAPLIHNSALWGTNAGKTSGAERGGEEAPFRRLYTLPRFKEVQLSSAEAGSFWNMGQCL